MLNVTLWISFFTHRVTPCEEHDARAKLVEEVTGKEVKRSFFLRQGADFSEVEAEEFFRDLATMA